MTYFFRSISIASLLSAVLLWALVMPAFAKNPAENTAYKRALPRTVIALYNPEHERRPRFSYIHRFVEMPLNHLGYRVHYHDINGPTLPEITPDIRAVTWFLLEPMVKNPDRLLDWANHAIDKGVKVIILGDIGATAEYRDVPENHEKINKLMNRLGMEDTDIWVNLTYDAKVEEADPAMVGFERELEDSLPGFMHVRVIDKKATSHLKVRHESVDGMDIFSDLVVTSPNGGYVAPYYSAYFTEDEKVKPWLINPFRFFAAAMGSDEHPKPDVTTLSGRRILYAHIDGDGWNNLSEVKKDDKPDTEPDISAEVIRREIFSRYTDIPFNVGIIAGDVAPDSCYSTPEALVSAKKILKLDNIEPSSHTYTHPIKWRFYADGNALKDQPLLKYYPPVSTDEDVGLFSRRSPPKWDEKEVQKLEALGHRVPAYEEVAYAIDDHEVGEGGQHYHGTPRSFACEPFSLEREIAGAAEFINSIAPEGKRVRTLQWSGDTSPFPEAIRMTRQHKLFNINGGDTRYDPEYPSLAWVSPIGLRVGDEWQVFSSNSNENTYTKLWQDRYYGYRYLQDTVRNTNTPIRLKPFNIYFHMYSGEKLASLKAVKENIEFAKKQSLTPIFTSQYAAIADGFFRAEIYPLGADKWQISNRGALQTIRFDKASDKAVNFDESFGVIGQHHLHGSLYVALDPAVKKPVISLTENHRVGAYPKAPRPYLIDSRWQSWNWRFKDNRFAFQTKGVGKGEWNISVPESGKYEVFINNSKNPVHIVSKNVNKTHLLQIGLNPSEGNIRANEPITILVRRLDS